MISPYHRQPSCSTVECLDDYLLRLILIDTVAMADSRRSQAAERVIEQFLPPYFYDRVMAHYDDLADDSDDERDLLAMWLGRAAHRGRDWKVAVLAQLLQVVSFNGVLEGSALAELSGLAQAIEAGRELAEVLELRQQ